MAKASLSLGDGSGTAVLGGIVNFLAEGGKVTTLLTASLTGLIVAPFVAFGDIVSAVTAFFTTPLTETSQSIGALAGAIFQAPAGLVQAGFTVTENVLRAFLGDSLAGLFAGPIAVGMVMLSLYLVVQYLQEDETGDTVVGLPIDLPTDFLGVEEEEDGADS